MKQEIGIFIICINPLPSLVLLSFANHALQLYFGHNNYIEHCSRISARNRARERVQSYLIQKYRTSYPSVTIICGTRSSVIVNDPLYPLGIFNTCMLNGFSQSYKLDDSISNLLGCCLVGGMFHFYSYFNRTLCKQTLKTRYRLILGLHYLHMSHKNLFNHLNGLYITLNVCPFIISRSVKGRKQH